MQEFYHYTLEFTVVGDRSVIEQGVRGLNLGPIDLLSIEDVLGKAPAMAN